MKKITVLRVAKEEEITRGVIMIDDVPWFTSLELPWRNNERNVSCIPEGKYECFLRDAAANITAGRGRTYEVENVPNRSGILFHVGNYSSDIRGCILVGNGYGPKMITESRLAFDRFMNELAGDSRCSLEIISPSNMHEMALSQVLLSLISQLRGKK